MRNFDNSYIKIAEVWAQNSRAIRNKVGAIIVKDNAIISDGFNGTPSGFENICETVECTEPNPVMNGNEYIHICGKHNSDESMQCLCCHHAKLTTKPYVLHAEANAITKLAKSGNSSDGATLYVTLSPCVECAKLIIQAGIKRVVYKELYRLPDGLEILNRAGIIVEQINDNMS